jgi:SAM-dependent methyltransferase
VVLSLAKRGFMKFWYPYVGMLNKAWPSITIDGKKLAISSQVYKPLENEHACIEYCLPDDRVLDLGCGSGVCAVFAAPKVREVVAVDISPAAVENTLENCRRFGLTNVTVKQSDMFANVEGKFDLPTRPTSRSPSRTRPSSSRPRPASCRPCSARSASTSPPAGGCWSSSPCGSRSAW